MIVVHKKDPVIPYPASSHLAARTANIKFQSVRLHQTPEQEAEAEAEERDVDHHFEPLNYYMTNLEGQPADEAIADFILPPPAAAAQQIA